MRPLTLLLSLLLATLTLTSTLFPRSPPLSETWTLTPPLSHRLVATEPAPDGTLVTATIDQAITHIGTNNPPAYSYTETFRLTLGTLLLYQTKTTWSRSGGDAITVAITWGPGITGAKNGTVVINNGTLTGTLDGQPFSFPLSADPGRLTFLDGTASPTLHLTRGGDLTPTLNQLVSTLRRGQVPPTSSANTTGLAARDLFTQFDPRGPTFNRLQDPGHFSGTRGAASCYLCKALVAGASAIAGGVCAATTCLATLGLGCFLCVGGAAVGAVKGIAECDSSPVCCPTHCGSGNPGQCCDGGEVCLDGNGRCCSASLGQVACVGRTCCAKDQSCIEEGVEKGLCCPDAKVCNSGVGCCGDEQDCVGPGGVVGPAGTVCCSKVGMCGDVCCDAVKGDVGLEFVCVDQKAGLCCLRGKVQVKGVCCDEGDFICGGDCCGADSTCNDKGQCVPPPQTPESCLPFKPCLADKECGLGLFCRGGCCAKIPT